MDLATQPNMSNMEVDDADDEPIDIAAAMAEQNNENRNKKRKKTEGPSLLQTSPSARALSIVSAYLASLQNPLPILGRQQYLKFAKLNKQRDDLIRRQAKLDPSTDYFPNSMNFNFTLQAPESLKGTTEYAALAESCKASIHKMKTDLREQSLKIIDLEAKALTKAISVLFCESVILFASTAVKLCPEIAEKPGIRNLVISTFEDEFDDPIDESLTQVSQQEYPPWNILTDDNILRERESKLLRYSCMKFRLLELSDLQDFFTSYHSVMSAKDAIETSERHIPGTGRFGTHMGWETIKPTFQEMIKVIFFDSRCEYLNQKVTLKRQATVTAWASTALDESASMEIALDIDKVNLQSPELQDLIDSRITAKVSKANATEKARIAQLEKQLRQLKLSKNGHRGGSSTTSSKTKRSQNNTNRSRKGQQAEDVVNDSDKGKKRNNKKNSRKSSVRNKRKSKN